MKKLLTAVCQGLLMAAIVFAATAAHARNPEEEAEKQAERALKVEHYKLYAKLGGGYSHENKQEYGVAKALFQDGYAVEGAVGYKLKRWRVEGALSYRDNKVDYIRRPNNTYVGNSLGDLYTTALMFNGYYDIPTLSGIKPYIGAGIGWAHVGANFKDGVATIEDSTTDTFAYQGIVGSNFNISDTFALYAEYRYFTAVGVEVDPLGTDGDAINHSVLFGLKYNFE